MLLLRKLYPCSGIFTIILLILSTLPIIAYGQSAPESNQIYLPLVSRAPWPSPFGVEPSTGAIARPEVQAQAQALGARWVRLNGSISWRAIQPTPTSGYDWSKLAPFEAELQAARAANLEPMVVVDDYPAWASSIPAMPGERYRCGPLSDTGMVAFRDFMRQLAARYAAPPLQVNYWELGNEPDVDPRLAAFPEFFGCWGNIDDPFYGGERYGRMLTIVTPAIRAANPGAQILIGGLLLDNPNTTRPGAGKPENFLEGILRVPGARDNFDIVPFHSYPSWPNRQVDYDNLPGNQWESRGGWIIGKARFLREVMARYGVNKPLFMNEGGLLCTSTFTGGGGAPCTPPPPAYFQAQADHVVRIASRGMAVNLEAIVWYTLDGPGWRSSSLLDENQNPRPVYTAYQHFIKQVTNSNLPPVAIGGYGSEIEAYRFTKGTTLVDVLWSRSTATQTVNLLDTQLVAVTTRDGGSVATMNANGIISIPVGFSPVYIERRP